MKIFKSINIIKFSALFFLALCFYSCSSTDSLPNCKVTSFSTYNLFYDELKPQAFAFDPSFTGRINLSYEDNKINKALGGLKNLSIPGQSLNTSLVLSNDVEDFVMYDGNSVTVNSNGLYSKTFVIVNNNLVSQTTTYSALLPNEKMVNYSPGFHSYEYIGDTVVENYYGNTRRIFYIENGNLSKVELFFRNFDNEIYKKLEYLFTEYDTTTNLLKGKFFLNGNFFKAFSNNNFKTLEIKTFDFVNGEFQLNQDQYASYNYGVVPQDLFTQDCQ